MGRQAMKLMVCGVAAVVGYLCIMQAASYLGFDGGIVAWLLVLVAVVLYLISRLCFGTNSQ